MHRPFSNGAQVNQPHTDSVTEPLVSGGIEMRTRMFSGQIKEDYHDHQSQFERNVRPKAERAE